MWKSKEKRCVECLWDGIGFVFLSRPLFRSFCTPVFFQSCHGDFFRSFLPSCFFCWCHCHWWFLQEFLNLLIISCIYCSMFSTLQENECPPQKNDLSTDCTSMRSPSFVSHHLLSLALGSKPIQKTCIYWKVHPWQLPAAPFWIHLLPQLSCCSLIHLHTRGGEHQSNLWLMQSTPWASARFCGWTVFHLYMLRRPTLSTVVLVWWAGMVMVVILLCIASPANAVAWCLLSLGVIVNVIYWKNITIIFVDWMMQRWQLKDALCQPLMLTSLGITYHWKIWSS